MRSLISLKPMSSLQSSVETMTNRARYHQQALGERAYLNFALTGLKAMLVLTLVFWSLMAVTRPTDEGTKPKAEFIIEVQWPDGLDTDIDTWLQVPNKQLVWYQQK